MTLKTNLFLQKKAQKGNYAVGAFNINNLEITKAIVQTAKELKSPIILQTSEGAIKYAGIKNLTSMVKNESEEANIPIALHLDHGKDFEVIKNCIKVGYSSVMFDGSHEKYEDNVKHTKKLVNLAHKKDVSVEAELGILAGVEDNVRAKNVVYTDPEQAKDFVERTGTDTLAIAIGTSHGAYKFAGESKLKIDILKDIRKLIDTPLVLHGASGVPDTLKNNLKKTGLELGKAKGVSDVQIQNAVKNGITKVNIDTDIRLAFTYGLRKFLQTNNTEFDPRNVMKPAMEEIKKIVGHKIKILGSANKA